MTSRSIRPLAVDDFRSSTLRVESELESRLQAAQRLFSPTIRCKPPEGGTPTHRSEKSQPRRVRLPLVLDQNWHNISQASRPGQDGVTHGASNLSNRNAFGSGYLSDLETPPINKWHSCPARSAFSFILTP